MPLFINSLCKTGAPPEQSIFDLVSDFDGDLLTWNAEQFDRDAGATLTISAGTHNAYGPDLIGSHGAISAYGPDTQTIVGAGEGVTFIEDLQNAFTNDDYASSLGTVNGTLPRIDTILIGEDECTLKDLDDVELFTVGQWVRLMGYDMQAFGFPQNNHFFEHRQITDINEGTGVLTLDQGVKYDYKDTYPELNVGSSSQPDQCGSATLMPIVTKYWDVHHHVKNMTINPTATNAFYGAGREITWESCTFENYAHIPSRMVSITYLDCTFNGGSGFEFDKSVETVTFTDCTVYDIITQQSSSIDDLVVTNSYISQLIGTPKRATLTDSTIDTLRLGCSAYGASRSTVIDTCDVGALTRTARSCFLDVFDSHTSGNLVISFTNAQSGSDALIDLVPDPGAWYRLYGENAAIGPSFQITDVTFDGNTDIFTYNTTLTGTEPQWALATRIEVVDCPDLTVTDSTGEIAFCSYAAAAGMALGEYFNSGPFSATYSADAPYITGTGDMNIATGYLCGEVVTIKLNVTVPYTGVNGECRLCLFDVNNFPSSHPFVDSTGAAYVNWTPRFDLKTAGERVITIAGVTGSGGADAGMSLGTARWWCSAGGIGYRLSHSIASESSAVWPEFTLEVILDQGIT
jgi:hypothetical protein